MSEAYHGREQTYLKHRVLDEYLAAWAQKLASPRGRTVDLWYVDVFAGPWESRSTTRDDTSIAISLRALNKAAATWAHDERRVRVHAVFVEKDAAAYQALDAFVKGEAGVVDVTTLQGAFGDHVDTIDRLVGDQAAFMFVDPTGWDGAALRFIAKLGRRNRRDLMINVMYDHLQRFKDDERAFLRCQMREFFGRDTDLPPALTQDQLMALYRSQLRTQSRLRFVADLAVPVPDRDRTKFRLVVAGSHRAVIKLFRDVEAKVIGKEAAPVRVEARARAQESRTGQPTLFPLPTPPEDRLYTELRDTDRNRVRKEVMVAIADRREIPFVDLWPRLLCEAHLTFSNLNQVLQAMEHEGLIRVLGRSPGGSAIKDQHVLTKGPAGQGQG